MNRSKKAAIIIMLTVTAAVCIALLFNVQIYASYAVWKTPRVEIKKEKLVGLRGNIYDRNGVLLAGTDENGRRYYPDNTAVHVIGALNSSGEAQSGTELLLDEQLSGTDGEIILEYTALKGEVFLSDKKIIPAKNGCDVYLTIDSRLQKTAEEILKSAIENHESSGRYGDYAPPSASGGAIVAADPSSGEILAMASAPDYSLESYSQDYDKIISGGNYPLLNRASQGLYRPGSTFKTITAFAALSEGAITPRTYFFCGEEYELEGTLFSCMSEHRFVTVKKALEVSCNIFFYKTALRLGTDALVRYGEMFGFGSAPDLELDTADGQLASPQVFADAGERWSDSQLVQAAIGQSKTECTPLQMAVQAEIIANRGTGYSPRIISHIINSSGELVYSSDRKISHSIPDRSGAFDTVIDGMKASTVYTYGEYALSVLPENTAIKTGTPQSPRGFDSAVIGFYPAEKPRIAFAVMLEDGANAKNSVRTLIESFLS